MNNFPTQAVKCLQQEEMNTVEKPNQTQQKNSSLGCQGQETKPNLKKAIRFTQLIGIIIF
jgi:hypothetical protein